MSKYPNRRHFLKLASGLLAAPFMSFQNAPAQSATGKAPLRLLSIFDSYGLASDNRKAAWIDSTVGDFALKSSNLGGILTPFAAHSDKLIVISNTNLESSIQTKDASTHDKLTSHMLTGSRLVNSVVGAAGTQHHPSVDVHIADYLTQSYGLPFPRVYPHLFPSEYPEPDKTSYCFDKQGKQIRAISGAGNIISSLFGGGSANKEEISLDAKSQNLALTLVRERLTSIRGELINANRAVVLDAYESSVQDLAAELELRANLSCVTPDAKGAPDSNSRNINSMPYVFESIYQAFACDLASVITYSVGGEQINQLSHGFLYDAALYNDAALKTELTVNLHAASHKDTPQAYKAQELARGYQASLIADLVNRLSTTPDVDGSMIIDNTIIFIGSTMSSNTHQKSNYCLAALAGKNTNLKTGFHYDCSGSTNNDLLTTLAQGMMIPQAEFGGFNADGNAIATLNNGPITKMLKATLS